MVMNFTNSLSKMSALSKELGLVQNSICIVEGLRDKRVLATLGFENIFDISGRSLYEVVQSISNRFTSAIILSDFDEEGEIIENYLKKNLQAKGVYINSGFRQKMRSLFGIKKIEELNSLAKFKVAYDSGEEALINKAFARKNFLSKRKMV